MNSSQKGLSVHDYNYLKCWVALIKYGKRVFQQIFLWGFDGPVKSIKDKLFTLPLYSNAQYKRDFNCLQREKIQNGSLQDFDLTLFYDLLQRVCRLPPPSSPVWGKEGTPGTLPNILYKIKMKRNLFAHAKLDISNEKMTSEVDELKNLLVEALGKAGIEYSIDPVEVSKLQDQLIANLQAIKCSHIGDVKANRMIVAKEQHTMALKQARNELFQSYNSFLKVPLAFHSPGDRYQNICDVFVEPVLKKMPSDILFQQIENSESIVPTSELLTLKLQNGCSPHVILLLSQSGMGKTTLSKYLIYDWSEGKNKVKELETYDLLFYINCRSFEYSSLNEYLCETLPQTAQLLETTDLKFLIISIRVVFILDNFDELRDHAVGAIEELFRLNSDKIKVIATSKQKIATVETKKSNLNLKLQGIALEDIKTCLQKINQTFSKHKSDERNLDQFCQEYLSKLNFLNSDFIHSPQTISHIFYHWIMKSKEGQKLCTTETQLFMASHQLLLEKIVDIAGLKNNISLLERHRMRTDLKEFFDQIFYIAFCYLDSSPLINVDHMSVLKEKLQKHKLPYQFIIPEVFYLEEMKSENLEVSLKVCFPSVSIHLFYAAMYIMNQISEYDCKLSLIISQGISNQRKSNLISQIVKYLVGIAIVNSVGNIEEKIKEIFSLVSDVCSPTTEMWLELVEEAHCNTFAISEASKYMKDSWSVSDLRISSVLVTMMKANPPKELTLTCSLSPDETAELKSVLMACSQLPNLKLNLQLYYHFWVEKSTFSDEYLTLLDFNCISMNQFGGRLTKEAFKLLPVNINRLALHVSPTDIQSLNKCLSSLKTLQLLYINLNINFDFSAKEVKRLKVPKRETILCVDLWNIDELHLAWACEVVAALSPCYCRLTLRKTKLTFDGAKKWLEGLRKERIHIDTAVIGSTQELLEDEYCKLQDLAQSFQCLEVKWIKI